MSSFSAPTQGLHGLRSAMDNALVRKLEGYIALEPEDKRLLNSIIRNIRHVPAHTDLATEDQKPTSVHLVLEGFACRYKCPPRETARSWPTSCLVTFATCM